MGEACISGHKSAIVDRLTGMLGETVLPSDALAVAQAIPPGPIGGDRHRALMPEACITGLKQYMESLMGTAGPSVLTEEQQARISASQHANSVRVTGIQTDRRWEVWGPVAKGIGLSKNGGIRFTVDSKLRGFYTDKVMSYPQLIVWAVEMRRMMDVSSVPEGVIRRLKETWVAQQTLGDFEEAITYWRKQLQKSLQSQNRMATEGGNHFRGEPGTCNVLYTVDTEIQVGFRWDSDGIQMRFSHSQNVIDERRIHTE
jgi:hypothetical protein